MNQLTRSALITVAVLAGAPAHAGDQPQNIAAERRSALAAQPDSPEAIKAFWEKVHRYGS